MIAFGTDLEEGHPIIVGYGLSLRPSDLSLFQIKIALVSYQYFRDVVTRMLIDGGEPCLNVQK